MLDVISEKKYKSLAILGKRIVDSLSCNVNDSGIPCVTDRLEAVENMKKYLVIHGYEIYEADGDGR